MFLLFLVLAGKNAFSQWENLNPGGGGQVQGITCDPNTPGRIYITSDVEGAYRSDDHGQSWQYIGRELLYHMAFYIQPEPGNANRLYCGSLYGLSYSDNAGQTWTTPATWPMYGLASACMAIDPANPDNLYVGNSFYNKDTPLETNKIPSELPSGDRVLWISKDRDATWQTITYDPVDGYKQCYTISLDPTNSDHVYLGTASGLFRSTDGGLTFSEIAPPAGFASCRGMDITPDGQFVYAVFATDEDPFNAQPSVFVAPQNATATWTWTSIGSAAVPNGLYYQAGILTSYWKPVISPRSTAAQHQVMIGCMWSNANGGQGLFEFTGTVSGATVSGSWDKQFGTTAPFTFDPGWNNLLPQMRQYPTRPPPGPTTGCVWPANSRCTTETCCWLTMTLQNGR